MRTVTRVPLPDGSKVTVPSCSISEPGSLRHDRRSGRDCSVITAFQAYSMPPGPRTTQCERRWPRSRTSVTCDMKRGKFSTSDQASNTSFGAASMWIAFSTSTWLAAPR